jgi:Lon-like ATP-dependent protease
LPEVDGEAGAAAHAAIASSPIATPPEDRTEATVDPFKELEGGEKPAPIADTASSDAEAQPPSTTTKTRKPMELPPDVSVKITSENLVDYVGPPVYQKDRLYTKNSPAGVSCGLGYLGNGSGSVMPIEATVRLISSVLSFFCFLFLAG